jgi:hypothetical protein
MRDPNEYDDVKKDYRCTFVDMYVAPDRSSGLEYLCLSAVAGEDKARFAALAMKVLPRLTRLRFFVDPIALTWNEADRELSVITALFPNGSLSDAMRESKNHRPLANFGPTAKSKCVFAIAFAMAQALSLEEFDLTLAANVIFLNADQEPVIAGFPSFWGSPLYDAEGDYLPVIEDVQWATPEELAGEECLSVPRMVYQFGMLVRFLFGGEVRFAGMNRLPGAYHIFQCLTTGLFWDRPEGIPDAYWEFIKNGCSNLNRFRRPTFQAIVDYLTDMMEYARYRSRLKAERIDAAQAERVREALARYKQSHSV